MGAWARSPCPMITSPAMAMRERVWCMASTAARSHPSRSPRPMSRAEARAAASVARTTSRARLRSMFPPVRRSGGRGLAGREPLQEVPGHALDPAVGVHAGVDGMAGGEQLAVVPDQAVIEAGAGAPDPAERGLPRDQVGVAGREAVAHPGLDH